MLHEMKYLIQQPLSSTSVRVPHHQTMMQSDVSSLERYHIIFLTHFQYWYASGKVKHTTTTLQQKLLSTTTMACQLTSHEATGRPAVSAITTKGKSQKLLFLPCWEVSDSFYLWNSEIHL